MECELPLRPAEPEIKQEIKVEVKEELLEEGEEEDAAPVPEIDIILNNVVCSFSVRAHLNLKHIAMNGNNVEFHREMGMLIMKFRRPRCTASIWSSGKITMTGSTTEDDAKVGARRCARSLQKLGYNVKFTNYRVVNVLATCTMPFAIKIADFSQAHPRLASYEPELHPGVTYKIKEISATLKIFSTGSITITAPSVDNIQLAVEKAYNLVFDYKKERRNEDIPLFPLSCRKRKREENKQRLKMQNGNGGKNNSKGSHKRARLDKYEQDFINDEEEEVEEGEGNELVIDEEDISPIFKSPVDESDEEEEVHRSTNGAAKVRS